MNESKKMLPSANAILGQAHQLISQRSQMFYVTMGIPLAVQFLGVLALFLMDSFAISQLFNIIGGIISLFASVGIMVALNDTSVKTVGEAYNASKSSILGLIWVWILTGIVTFLGFIVFVIPGVYLSIAFMFASYALIVDKKRGWDAAKHSKEMVAGYWWPVFGRCLLVGIYALLVYGVFMVAFGSLSMVANEMVGGIVTSAVAMVLSLVISVYGTAFTYVFYRALKSVKA